MHLRCEMWRRIGPMDLGPPIGSFLDLQFRGAGLDIHFPARIDLRQLKVWVANAKAKEQLETSLGSSQGRLQVGQGGREG
jgi:hypothetical protein